MPELAELRLTADYVNIAARGRAFRSIGKNPEHKGEALPQQDAEFTISAQSRGKELMLFLKTSKSETRLLMTMGMAGHFAWVGKNEQLPKHTHLWFSGDSGSLCFVDVRRFGKWKIASGWSSNRGPDPTLEYEAFVENLRHAARGKRGDKPLHLAMLDQSIFSGIGNYLRAEIIYRLGSVNPFAPLREVVEDQRLAELCRDIPLIAYRLGGGQLKDWKSPTGEDPAGFREFILCYGRQVGFKDAKSRTFWMDPKWIPHAQKYHDEISRKRAS